MQQLAEGIYVESTYEGVNVGAVVTRRGIICVDAPSYPKDARHWSMRLRQISVAPIQYVVLLDPSGDRILNTRWLNTRVVAHQVTSDRLTSYDKRYPQVLIDALTERNYHAGRELSSSPVDRPDFSFTDGLKIIKNDVEIALHAAPGPSQGGIVAFLPRYGILFTGDLVTAENHPPMLEADLKAWQASLIQIKSQFSGAKIVVPGRGPIGDLSLIDGMQRYLALYESCGKKQVENGSKQESSAHIAELLNVFPSSEVPIEWARQQVKLGLANVVQSILNPLNSVSESVETLEELSVD